MDYKEYEAQLKAMELEYPDLGKYSSLREELGVATSRLARRSTMAFGEFLSIPQWNWFVTQTFSSDFVSERSADRHWQFWYDGLVDECRVAGLPRPFYARGTEYQDRGTLHYHSLIGGVGDIRRLDFKDRWEHHGFSRVLPYNPKRGASYYLGKYLTKGQADIRLSHNLKLQLRGVAP